MRGWYKDNYRHSLAAKGVRTSHLFKKDESKKLLDVFKSPDEKYDAGHEISRTFSGRIKQRLLRNMEKLESEGLMSMEDDRRFMENEFAPLEAKFINRNITADQFKDEIDRSYKLFYQHHKKAVHCFGGEPAEPSLYEDGEKRNSIWGW